MEIEVSIKKTLFSAKAVYKEDCVIVKAGSSINPAFASYIKGISLAKKMRDNSEYVNSDWVVIKDCSFPSLSTAAQFVMGQSRDGYDAWKLDNGKSIGSFLEEQGLYVRAKRNKK